MSDQIFNVEGDGPFRIVHHQPHANGWGVGIEFRTDTIAEHVAHFLAEAVKQDEFLATATPDVHVGQRWIVWAQIERFPHFVVPEGTRGTITDINSDGVISLKLDDWIPGAEEWDNEIVFTVEDDHPDNRSAAHALIRAARPIDDEPVDYHTEVTRLYAPTVRALGRLNLTAEVIETGGGCKAIEVTAFEGRKFADGIYMMLTAGGPLTNERDPECNWELGVYLGDEYGTESVAEVNLPADKPEYDTNVAELVERVARTLRIETERQPAAGMSVEDRLHELAGIIEVGDPDQIIGYLRAGNHAAAVELLEQSAHLHMAALNPGKADTLMGLADEIGEQTFADAPPMMLVVNDTDTGGIEYVTEGGEVDVIELNLDLAYGGEKRLDLDSEMTQEWIDTVRKHVTPLPADSPIRRRVVEIFAREGVEL